MLTNGSKIWFSRPDRQPGAGVLDADHHSRRPSFRDRLRAHADSHRAAVGQDVEGVEHQVVDDLPDLSAVRVHRRDGFGDVERAPRRPGAPPGRGRRPGTPSSSSGIATGFLSGRGGRAKSRNVLMICSRRRISPSSTWRSRGRKPVARRGSVAAWTSSLMAVSGLRTSWAMPAAIWPTQASCSARSASRSVCLSRCSTAAAASVTRWSVPSGARLAGDAHEPHLRRGVEQRGGVAKDFVRLEERPAERGGDHPPASSPPTAPAHAQPDQPDGEPLGELLVRLGGLGRASPSLSAQVLAGRLQDLLGQHRVDQLEDLRVDVPAAAGSRRSRSYSAKKCSYPCRTRLISACSCWVAARGLGLGERLRRPLPQPRHRFEVLAIDR